MKTAQEIKDRHNKQLAMMQGWLTGRGFFKALEALEFVRSLETGFRKDGVTPAFHHQLAVARLTSTLVPHLRYPEQTMTAAFLHDVLEDHGVQYPQEFLAQKFGVDVAESVQCLSKKYQGEIKTYQDYFLAMSKCHIASVVKLADRAHNIQTMIGVFSEEKQRQYLSEVETWFMPLIHEAKRNCPRQYSAYENLKILLYCQSNLLAEVLR